jgi:hypothetical protein
MAAIDSGDLSTEAKKLAGTRLSAEQVEAVLDVVDLVLKRGPVARLARTAADKGRAEAARRFPQGAA